MTVYERSLAAHKAQKGKISVESKMPVTNKEELSIAYTPGVAEPCRVIADDKNAVYDYCSKGNLVAVVSDGSAVLGLGNIGGEASMPVMEGKAVLFKNFANVDAFPICLDTQDTDEIVNIVKALKPTFGGINLEDISSPRCFEIEERLVDALDIPVFHDDQHGTAIVVSAGVINGLRLVGKKIEDVTAVINGPGAAGTAIAKMLMNLGIGDLIMCDQKGILDLERPEMADHKKMLAKASNKTGKKGLLTDALEGADIFIGVSVANCVNADMISKMNRDAIVFAMANPTPEIMPEIAKKAGVRVMGTGRSDFPNQINNVIAFPGIFRGALDAGATKINKEMKLASVYAIADIITEDELNEDYIIPNPFDERIVKRVAEAVAKAAHDTGVIRK
ncbi:NAD(P)-dependent malic enzyme [Fusibacter sp. JL216-2]|uniref:NAD(P)-dependent malic enzyme n=1 Tax=Fusibacter sp. JL216-2 TaxID=3071453 RepID=UPI003D350797